MHIVLGSDNKIPKSLKNTFHWIYKKKKSNFKNCFHKIGTCCLENALMQSGQKIEMEKYCMKLYVRGCAIASNVFFFFENIKPLNSLN